MKAHALLVRTMGLLLAVASVASLAQPGLLADELKASTTLGTPKAGATSGVGFATTDSHLALAFSPDGKTLASASLDGTVRLWDLPTGKQKASFKEQGCQLWSIAFSPNGKTLALGGWEKEGDKFIGIVRLWEAPTGKEKDTFEKRRYGVYSVAFSPDGKTLASGGDDCIVRMWDVESAAEKATFFKHPAHRVLALAFSPDGKTLAAAGGSPEPKKDGKFPGMVRLWDVNSGKETASCEGHSHWISSIAFSRDGKTLVSGSYDGTVRLWDVLTGKQKAIFKGRESQCGVLSVAFSPDGMTLASGSVDRGGAGSDKGVGRVRLWDVTTGDERATLEPHGPFVTSVAFSPDGKTLASGCGDTTVKLWNVPVAENPGTPPDDAKQEAIKKEKKSLIGTWKLISCEAEGEKVPEKILRGEVVRWAITENTITVTVEGEVKDEDKYTLDPTAKPKVIDLTDKESERTPGIYSLEGDTLKICMNEKSSERPTEFISKPDTHLSVWVFKREKR